MHFSPRQLDAVRQAYFALWENDDLIQVIANAPTRPWPRNMRHMVHDLLHVASKSGVPLTVNGTVLELIDMGVLQLSAGTIVPAQDHVFKWLCAPAVQRAAFDALTSSYIDGSAHVQDALRSETGYPDAQSMGEALRAPGSLDALSQTLWRETRDWLATKTIEDYFIRTRSQTGFYLWTPHAFSPNSDALCEQHVRRRTAPTPCGDVVISVYRNSWIESDVLNVYEWEARLVREQGIDAVAVGSLYIRKKTSPYSVCCFALGEAADQVSEKDILLADAFLKEYCEYDDDALDCLFDSGDLMTVLHWERAAGAPAQCGAAVLKAAIGAVKRSYRSISHLVMDGRPSQFRDWSLPHEPEMIQARKAYATKKLYKYVESLQLERGLSSRGESTVFLPMPAYDEDSHPHDEVYRKFLARHRERQEQE